MAAIAEVRTYQALSQDVKTDSLLTLYPAEPVELAANKQLAPFLPGTTRISWNINMPTFSMGMLDILAWGCLCVGRSTGVYSILNEASVS